jgi:stress response protein SCP2
MTELNAGANAALPSSSISVLVEGDLDLTALVVSADGKVASDADMVFFNQPSAPGLSLSGRTLTADLSALRPGADKVVLAASPEAEGATLGSLAAPTVRVSSGGTEVASFSAAGLTSQSVVVLVELYQRAGAWKVRAVGAGYDSGLAGLAQDFGVSVDSDDAGSADAASTPSTSAPTAPPTTPPAPAISLAKKRVLDLEKKLESNPKMLDLVKTAGVSLAKKGLSEHTARVVLCLDVSGSMSDEYRTGAVQALVERVAALGLRFDDDGQIEVYLFGERASRFGSVGIEQVATVGRDVYATGLQYGTRYGAVLELVLEDHRAHGPRANDVPTLVLFVTDGQTQDRKLTEETIRALADEAVFVQFMGIGRESSSEFAFLRKLDDLKGRRLDNADFFAMTADEINGRRALSDDEVFSKLTNEYPKWVEQAKSAGVITA